MMGWYVTATDAVLNYGFPRSTRRRFLYSIGDLSHIEPNKNHQTSIHKTKQKLTLERICCFFVVDRSYTCMKWHSYDNTSFHSDAAHCSSVIRLLVVVDMCPRNNRVVESIYLRQLVLSRVQNYSYVRDRPIFLIAVNWASLLARCFKLSVIAGKMHSLLSR